MEMLSILTAGGMLFLASGWAWSQTVLSKPSKPIKKPNLLVIMADDLGYVDVGFQGSKDIKTPHLDALAASGVICSRGYVAYPVCGPSRASFITGRYGQRFGFERNPLYNFADPKGGVDVRETTIASALKKVGYHNGIIGKWHLGSHPSMHPDKRGFDEFFGMIGGGHMYFPKMLTIKDHEKAKSEHASYRTWIRRNDKPVKVEKYLTRAFSDEAVSFIKRNKEKPFFLFLSYNAPHGPLQAEPKDLARYPNIANKKRQTYAAMVSVLDDGVGQVMKTLREEDLEQDTLIFFLSDNGGPESKNASNNGPLRGEKSSPYEGGLRVPYVVSWKGTLPAGQTCSKPVSSLDIFATIADLAKAPTDPSRPLDGENIIPLLKGGSGAKERVFFLRKWDQKIYCVWQGQHKLVAMLPDEKRKIKQNELFDLAKDKGERHALVGEAADLESKRLMGLAREWEKGLIEPVFKGLWMQSKERQKARESRQNSK